MLPCALARAPSHGDAFKEEFLAMTFVAGPNQASFLDEKPAKLRFFIGYADEFAPGDGSDRVSDNCPWPIARGVGTLVWPDPLGFSHHMSCRFLDWPLRSRHTPLLGYAYNRACENPFRPSAPTSQTRTADVTNNSRTSEPGISECFFSLPAGTD